ncbi:AMP-binding protein [Geomesophilobacter sediminis]|nr:AMP-binding protein [Geomesophilobacter sediminis]
MRWVDSQGTRIDYSFEDLDRESNRFANLLSNLGFGSGDIFFTFLPKMPEQFFAFLGALKLQVICGTMFSNFGEEALLDRLGDSGAKGIITKTSLLKKLLPIRKRLPDLQYVIVVDGDDDPDLELLSYRRLLAEASPDFLTPLTQADTPSVLHYTSGSTGKPKGVLHRHGSVVLQSLTAREVLSLTHEDLFWCTADPGWVTGTSYGIIGPWSLGVPQLHYGGGYDAKVWMQLLEQEKVTVWYSAPTALRMLMREDTSIFASVKLSSLRHIFSVGEPLNPEVISWAQKVLNHEVYDTWFQTETGAIMISNRPGLKIRPGSMGKPVPGIQPAILDDTGKHQETGIQGNLCLKPDWPSMFVTYLNNEKKYQERFQHGFYHTGDTAVQDSDGYYWFMGRNDDIINTAGHLVGPFEVESALLEMEEIAESGVIGAPDELMFEKIVAFVALHPRYTPSPELELKIKLHVANKGSSTICPHEIIFCDSVPKNKSGKIMRRVLRAKYLGQDPGDISTMDF